MASSSSQKHSSDSNSESHITSTLGPSNSSLALTFNTARESVHLKFDSTNESFASVDCTSKSVDNLLTSKDGLSFEEYNDTPHSANATPTSTTNTPIVNPSSLNLLSGDNSESHFAQNFDTSEDSLMLTFNKSNETVTLTFDSSTESLTSVDTAFTSVATPLTSNGRFFPNEQSDSQSSVDSAVTSIMDTDTIRSPSPTLSIATITATPTSSQLFGTTSLDTLPLSPCPPIVYSHIHNLPSLETWEKWTRGYYVGDPFDSRVKASIFFDEGHQIYRSPFSDTDRILPSQASLELLPPTSLPHRIRDIPCLAMSSSLVHTPVLGPGTFLPANMVYRRSLVLAPFFHADSIYYVLCLHDDDDVFLIRVHERFMDNRWSSWKQLRQSYGNNFLGALFSAGIDTFDQILEGVKRQHSVDRYVWAEPVGNASSLSFLPIIWKSLKNPCR
ncbi:hypothetical protein BDP27DRAFT_1416537 [Rhodocollybia butyracea]|uniref:Uncharacterized protein n=1 Tax=Rhodocollybia butyracea TaxID=206335 RepID=A0A9P5UCK6_9AGAR|nr:hypothetical protein BDP27DRAFT_1416537 [Rhodocollybia butyracea]